MATLAEVEEALQHTAAVPVDQRGDAWHAYVDGPLTKRDILTLEQTFPSRSPHMPTRDDIERAILGVTGAPDTGLLHDATPALVDAIDELINPKPTEAAAYKPAKETR